MINKTLARPTCNNLGGKGPKNIRKKNKAPVLAHLQHKGERVQKTLKKEGTSFSSKNVSQIGAFVGDHIVTFWGKWGKLAI